MFTPCAVVHGHAALLRRLVRLLVFLFGVHHAVHAEDGMLDLKLPAQALGSALESLARASGVQLVYRSELVTPYQSPAIDGRYTAKQALAILLRPAGLAFRRTDSSTAVIKKPERVAANEAPETKKTKEQAKEPQPLVLEEMMVTATARDETSYTVPKATTATKTDTPFSIHRYRSKLYHEGDG